MPSAEPTSAGRPGPPGRLGGRRITNWVLAGLVVGFAWRALTPVAVGLVDTYETQVAGDVTFAVLGVGAGVVVGLAGLVRPGPGAASRFVMAVFGSAVASVTAWAAGRLLGAPALALDAVLLLWPFTVAVLTVTVSLVATLFVRDPL